jgi:O-antigen/teichoic acid export membrane protein
MWTALPLGIGITLVSLQTNVPRYFLARYWSEADLGEFSAIANLMVIGMSMVTALGQVLAPRLARSHAARDRNSYLVTSKRFFLAAAELGALGVIVAIVAGGPLLSLIYTAEYASASRILILVMLAGLGGHMLAVMGFMINAANVFRPQVPLQALSLAVVVLVSWLAIPKYGIAGAAVALMVTNGVTVVWGAGLAWHCVRRLGPRSRDLA